MSILTIVGLFLGILFLYKLFLILNNKKYYNDLNESDIKYNKHSRFININLK